MFPLTRHSVVARTRSSDEETRRVAWATLIEAYWKPVHKYLCLQWSLDADAAADLTQEFFAASLGKSIVERYDPARARFRTYLRLCLDGFAANARKSDRRQKRGGGVSLVPLEFETTTGDTVTHEPAAPADLDDLFYREWVRALFERSVDALRRASADAGRSIMFEIFARYDLAPDDEPRPTYAAVARDLGLTTTMVTNHLAAMRRQFRAIVLDRLRELTATDAEFESEAARLLGGGALREFREPR